MRKAIMPSYSSELPIVLLTIVVAVQAARLLWVSLKPALAADASIYIRLLCTMHLAVPLATLPILTLGYWPTTPLLLVSAFLSAILTLLFLRRGYGLLAGCSLALGLIVTHLPSWLSVLDTLGDQVHIILTLGSILLAACFWVQFGAIYTAERTIFLPLIPTAMCLLPALIRHEVPLNENVLTEVIMAVDQTQSLHIDLRIVGLGITATIVLWLIGRSADRDVQRATGTQSVSSKRSKKPLTATDRPTIKLPSWA